MFTRKELLRSMNTSREDLKVRLLVISMFILRTRLSCFYFAAVTTDGLYVVDPALASKDPAGPVCVSGSYEY
jgi:hypothetical protein